MEPADFWGFSKAGRDQAELHLNYEIIEPYSLAIEARGAAIVRPNVKIPFALRLSDGQLVEAGDVVAGRGCNCVCPSCGLGVVAKKGDVNEWHFAHDGHSEAIPHSLCEVSFFSCCRQFVTDTVCRSPGLSIKTPDYVVEEKRHGFSTVGLKDFAARESVIKPSNLSKDSRYDLVAHIACHTIFIHLSYPDRKLPDLPTQGPEGVLSIDLEFIARQYKEIKSQPELLRRLTMLMFEQETDCKRWLYHPREIGVRARLRKRLETEVPELDQAAQELRRMIVSKKGTPIATRPVNQIPPNSYERNAPGAFHCLLCSAKWRGHEFTDKRCSHCSSHLGSRFIADL